jgi:RimJ/RimL family protein N-acetyltransferase
VAAILGIQPSGPHYVIGFEEDGKPRGAVIFSDYTGQNIEIGVVGLWSKLMFRVMGNHCFRQLRVQRVTARTRVSNVKVARVIERAGFRREGIVRSYYPGGEDAILFGMLRDECRWWLD